MRLRLAISALFVTALAWGAVGCGTAARVKNATLGKLKLPGGKDRRGDAEPDPAGAGGGATKILGGTIELVQPAFGFVLIRSTGSTPPPPGAELFAHRRGEADPVAQLRVSPEKKTGFVVADLLSGSPRQGDVVMWSLPDAPPPDASPLDLPGEFLPRDFEPVPPSIDPETMRPDSFRPVPTVGEDLDVDPEAELERELRLQGGPPY